MKKYKKEFDYSYTLGAFPTMELVNSKKYKAIKIVVSSKFDNEEVLKKIKKYCQENHIEFEVNDKTIEKISDKENCYVIGFFKKEYKVVDANKPHVVLVNPANTGNLGNIMRTMMGFNLENLIIIRPSVDAMDPKTIRASMGALFHLNIEFFDNFKEYQEKYPYHEIYPFMLKGKKSLSKVENQHELYSLVFGNESSGLDDSYLNFENTVIIRHTNKIDSLNLTTAIALACYEFTKEEFND